MADESVVHSDSPETPSSGAGEAPIDLTEAAATEVKRLMAQENLPGRLLRVGVVGGGCAGLNYEVNFDDKTGKFDRVFDIKGMVIDYVPAIVGGGFRFENPNAGKSCGCGTSFSV